MPITGGVFEGSRGDAEARRCRVCREAAFSFEHCMMTRRGKKNGPDGPDLLLRAFAPLRETIFHIIARTIDVPFSFPPR
jgi:hypothetical protein